MNPNQDMISEFGGTAESFLLFADVRPELLPYATILAAKDSSDADLAAVQGVYEWQGRPLLFVVDREKLTGDPQQIRRLRRIVAMRGDAPYLAVIEPGRLAVYRADLESYRDGQDDPIALPEKTLSQAISYLGNKRPGIPRQRYWISDVVLRLLYGSLATLTRLGIESRCAISLVGRALFIRFLADRDLLPRTITESVPGGASGLFDNANVAERTSDWLDQTFNGDFLPLENTTLSQLSDQAFLELGNILRRAPGGQLALGWAEKWDNLDFAHIPVGVLSQAYERYLSRFHRDVQKKQGGYYTPRHIADLMVRGAFEALKRSGNAAAAKVLDPAAGAGVFLLTAFRELVAERWRADGVRPGTAILREILYNQITGFDIDESALRFAALGLYLISIELDPDPEPVAKLRFEDLRPRVLQNLRTYSDRADLFDVELSDGLGALGHAVGPEHLARYDLVIGNPPWSTSTGLNNWRTAKGIVDDIARRRLEDDTSPPLLPNQVLDLPFVWRAMDWAVPGGQIAFALHARLLFLQGEGMPIARSALFRALDVTGVINGTEVRRTNVWPEISAPFCLLFARNVRPSPTSGFRFVSPRLDETLNSAGSWRVDAANAELVLSSELQERPELLKILFCGSRLDIEAMDRISWDRMSSLADYWGLHDASYQPAVRTHGNGYQRLRKSSRIRKSGDGLPGVSAEYLFGIPEVTKTDSNNISIEEKYLRPFSLPRIHDPRSRSLFQGPLLLIGEAPSAESGQIPVTVSMSDVVFSQSFHGYSTISQNNPQLFAKYLALVLRSPIALWIALLTSGRFGFEREVIEKFTFENIPVPRFEDLTKTQLATVERHFEEAANNIENASSARSWIADLYGLNERDLQVVEDTLRYGLPFSRNRKLAQSAPSDLQVADFLSALKSELDPWFSRTGSAPPIFETFDPSQRIWRFVRIGPARREPATWDDDQEGAAKFADECGLTEMVFSDPITETIWIGRLNQARYWTHSQARLVARRIIWDQPTALELEGARNHAG